MQLVVSCSHMFEIQPEDRIDEQLYKDIHQDRELKFKWVCKFLLFQNDNP